MVTLKYRREIDGLRAIAVLFVIFFHAGVNLASGGFLGVDVFFVISGYLITTLIFQEQLTGTFSIAKFYERRIRRILPALFLVMFVCLPFAWFWLLPSQQNSFAKSIYAVVTYMSNVLFWKESGYFDSASELKPLLHTWSLSVEEQYYVLFPLFLSMAWRFARRAIVPMLVGATILSFTFALWASVTKPSASFFLLPARGWELLFGAIAAIFLVNHKDEVLIPPVVKNFWAFIGLILILLPMFLFDKGTTHPGVSTLAPTLGTVLIIIFATAETEVGKILGHKYLVGVGLISYSLYLWHHPIFVFVKIRFESQVAWWVAVILVFALSYLSWRFVEIPIRANKKYSRRFVFLSAGFTSALLLVIATIIFGMSKSKIDYLMPIRSDSQQLVDSCFLLDQGKSEFDVKKCITKIGDRKRVLMIGDSHSASLYPGLHSYLADHQVNFDMLSAAFCLPVVTEFPKIVSQAANERCSKINRQVRVLLANGRYDAVIVSSFMYEWGFRKNPSWTYDAYYSDFLRELNILSQQHKIIVVGQFPIWKMALPDILAQEFATDGFERIEDAPVRSINGIDESMFSFDDRYERDISALGIKYISLIQESCIEKSCLRYISTSSKPQLVSFDYGHLSLAASEFFAKSSVGPSVLKSLYP